MRERRGQASVNAHMLEFDPVQGGIISSAFSEERCGNELDIICQAIGDAWTKATTGKIHVYHF